MNMSLLSVVNLKAARTTFGVGEGWFGDETRRVYFGTHRLRE